MINIFNLDWEGLWCFIILLSFNLLLVWQLMMDIFFYYFFFVFLFLYFRDWKQALFLY